MQRKDIVPGAEYVFKRGKHDVARRVLVTGRAHSGIVVSWPGNESTEWDGRIVAPRNIIELWAEYAARLARRDEAIAKADSEARIRRGMWAPILDDLRAAGIRFDASGRDDLNGVYHEHDRLTVQLSVVQAQKIVDALAAAKPEGQE